MLGGCRTSHPGTPEPPFVIDWPARFPVDQFTFTCNDSYVADMIEHYSMERMIASADTNTEADVAITCTIDFQTERKISSKAWFNILTLPVGMFFFYFNVDAESYCDTVLRFKKGEEESFKTSHKARYKHPGYLPESEEGIEKKVLFYSDIREDEHSILAEQTAIDIVVRSGKMFSRRER